MRFLPQTIRGGVLIVLFLVVVLVIVATPRLFIWPPTDQPVRSNAVVALGGDPGQLRAKKALQLARAGFAPVAVISLGGEKAVSCPHRVAGVQIVCFRADPLDTQGEAEYVAGLVAQRHWKRIIVVSGRSQATRARLLFERCTPAQLVMDPVADTRSRLFFDVTYEWGALLKALVLKRSC
jgi:uncharacterized SAM-binding protein YcdF (DUF218 family)